MKTGLFLIRFNNDLIEVNGQIDELNGIGYYEDDSLIWNEEKVTATDISTGTKICNANTIEWCINKVNDMLTLLQSRRQTEAYKTFLYQFNFLKENNR